RPNDLHVQDVGDPYQQEDQHLPTNTLESHLAIEFPVRYGAHHARDVVRYCKYYQGNEQSIIAAKEVAKPPSHSGEHHLDHIPKFLHVVTSVSLGFVYEKSGRSEERSLIPKR